jgi:hypothetical protein
LNQNLPAVYLNAKKGHNVHDVVDVEITRKQKQKECFMWHKQMNRDNVLTCASVRIANLFMQDFDFMRKGIAHRTHHEVMDELTLSAPTVSRSFRQLLGRRHLIPGNEKDTYLPGPGAVSCLKAICFMDETDLFHG